MSIGIDSQMTADKTAFTASPARPNRTAANEALRRDLICGVEAAALLFGFHTPNATPAF